MTKQEAFAAIQEALNKNLEDHEIDTPQEARQALALLQADKFCEYQTGFISDLTAVEMDEALDEGCAVFGGEPILCGKPLVGKFRGARLCQEHLDWRKES